MSFGRAGIKGIETREKILFRTPKTMNELRRRKINETLIKREVILGKNVLNTKWGLKINEKLKI